MNKESVERTHDELYVLLIISFVFFSSFITTIKSFKIKKSNDAINDVKDNNDIVSSEPE